jgi:xanthine dehydrogenase YagR molybdenum-binding subunit
MAGAMSAAGARGSRRVWRLDAVILDGHDDKANPFGVKGAGEIGVCGGAAVANAVFNATGVRVRDFPVTLDKVLANLP